MRIQSVFLLLAFAIGPLAVFGQQDDARGLDALRTKAFSATQPEELLAAFSAIAAVDTDEARRLLLDILKDQGRGKLLDVQVPLAADSAPSRLRQDRYMGHALDAAVARMPKKGEPFLLKDLGRDWGQVGALQQFPPGYQVSTARIIALGALADPSKAVYDALAGMLGTDDYRDGAATIALLRLGDAQAAAELRKAGKAEKEKTGAYSHLLCAQHARNKPAIFELLVDGYRMYGTTDYAGYFLQAITSPGYIVNSLPADQTNIPAYASIATAADQKKIVELIDSLLTNPGPRKLSDKERTALAEVKGKVSGLKLK